MKNVYYIGFYDSVECKKRIGCSKNMAGTMKMKFIIGALKSLGYHVTLLSICIGEEKGYINSEHIYIDDKEEHIFLPYCGIGLGKKVFFRGITAWLSLRVYALLNFGKDDIVVTYHSLLYKRFWDRLRQLKGFVWIPQVEEIYCLSRADCQDTRLLSKEEEMFQRGDGFLFVNDIFATKYANGKPFAVSYGNYSVFLEKEAFHGEKIKLVYTGIINQDRGVFRIIDAMKHLPKEYELHILGYGTESNINQMHIAINEVNKDGIRVFFDGTRTGSSYTEYLAECQIGISLMDTSDAISQNAFPSKILAYLGHSLFVVSSKCSSIVNSKVSDILYFCEDSSESIANTIRNIPITEQCSGTDKLRELRKEFLVDLNTVLIKAKRA